MYYMSTQRGPIDFLAPLARRVIEAMKEDLSRDFGVKEVFIVLQQMHPNRALGSDGMSPLFYQKYWSIMGQIVTEVAIHTLNSG